jgi:Na+/proline symporter
VFFFEDAKAGTYFWKQFLAGVFMVIATTGLDQDMMQRNLACKDSKESQKNMIVSSVIQFFVIALFLVLGTLLVIYMSKMNMAQPEKADEIFGMVAQSKGMPVMVLVLFVLGLISAAYSAAGSAITSLTTSFTVDILDGQKRYNDAKLTKVRKMVHIMMSVLMGLVIIVFYYASDQDAISAVYTLASYTYGPILGLFVFGMFTKMQVRDKMVPVVCVLAPALSWVVQWQLKEQFDYTTSFELLIINAVLTVIGLALLSKGKVKE